MWAVDGAPSSLPFTPRARVVNATHTPRTSPEAEILSDHLDSR